MHASIRRVSRATTFTELARDRIDHPLGGSVRKIEVGQHYKKTGASWTVWVVVEEFVDRDRLRHFRLRDVKDPTNTKLVSEHALANARLYEPVA